MKQDMEHWTIDTAAIEADARKLRAQAFAGAMASFGEWISTRRGGRAAARRS